MKKHSTAVAHTLDDNLEQQALSKFNSGNYKEAIRLYKTLWQNAENNQWGTQLASSYLQRAISFANRGMVKEAIVLWENQAQYTQAPYEAFDQYICWLIQAKSQTKLESCLQQLSIQQLDKELPDLACLLGFLMLIEQANIQHNLPQDSLFITHFQLVKTAFQAYQNDQLDVVSLSLKQIPYRSAFKDFRTLLNATITMSTDIEQAQVQLSKIADHSPYSTTAKMLLACTLKDIALTQDLPQFNHHQQRIIENIIGFSKKQLQFIDQVTQQNNHLSDKLKFNLAIQYQSLIGADLAQQFCHSLLADYPAGRRQYIKNFKSIDDFEENRLKALVFERDNNHYDAEFYWRQCINDLAKDPTTNNFKIALILRHIATNQHDEEQIHSLIESLNFDSEDKASYLKILRYYGQHADTKNDYKLWMSKTLDKFPQDIDILTQATKNATANKSYKKASQYAIKILKIDPINTFAKLTLFSSHLAHARRLILNKKFHLVENEIQQAEKLNVAKSFNSQSQLLRGLFCFASEDKKQGLEIIVKSLTTLYSDPINAHLHAAMEAQLTGLPIAPLIRALPPIKDHLLTKNQLTQLIQFLDQTITNDDSEEFIYKALEKIKSALKKSLLANNFTEEHFLQLCPLLDKVNHFELLRYCVKLALNHWNKPIWHYYKLYADLNGIPEQCSYNKIIHLEKSLDQVNQESDYATALLINAFLDRYYLAHPDSGMDFLDNIFAQNEEDEYEYLPDPIENLFEHLPDDIYNKISIKMDGLIKKTSPEHLVKEFGELVGHDIDLLYAIMQQPEIFTALMILKSADSLQIDIGVSVDDVLTAFGLSNKNGAFPF